MKKDSFKTFRLPSNVMRKIKCEAQAQGLSESAVIRQALRIYLTQRPHHDADTQPAPDQL